MRTLQLREDTLILSDLLQAFISEFISSQKQIYRDLLRSNLDIHV